MTDDAENRTIRRCTYVVTIGVVCMVCGLFFVMLKGCEQSHIEAMQRQQLKHEEELEAIRAGRIRVDLMSGWIDSSSVKPEKPQ